MAQKKKPTGKAETPQVYEVNISDLTPDDRNLNRGTEFGGHLIEKSLRELGAGRSILLDKNNRIIAGNKTTENAAAIDLSDVIVVETDGTKLVAVKRTDVELDSEQGRKLALADNATSAANLEWDEDEMRALSDELDGFNPEDWGVSLEAEEEEGVDTGKLIAQASSDEAVKEYSEDTDYDLRKLFRQRVSPNISINVVKGVETGQIRPEIAEVLNTRLSQCAIFNFDEIIKYYRSKDASPIEKELLRRLYLVFVAPKELFTKGILHYKETTQQIYDDELLTNDYPDESETD